VDEPKRILVSRIRQIGDVILTLPVLDALRARFPDAVIDYLAEENPAAAAVGHPALHRVLTLRRGRWPGLPAPPLLLAALRRARYDWVIDLYGNPRSALLARITGAPVRVGPARRSRRRLFTHAIPPQDPSRSAIDYHLSALRSLGVPPGPVKAPRIHLSDVERTEGTTRLDQAVPPGQPRVGLHVGNRWPAKRWPEERFSALLRALSKLGARGVVLAGPGEEALARRVADGARLAGRGPAPVIAGLPLRSYFAVVAALDTLVTNDGSPLHVGPAVQVPTVGILGPTVPEIWFPYSREDGHQLLCKAIWCRPCHRHECGRLDCLEWIEVGEALQATAKALTHGGRVRASA
jgi:heptosyltransferase-2